MRVETGRSAEYAKVYYNSPYGLYENKSGGYILHCDKNHFMTWGTSSHTPNMVQWYPSGSRQEYQYLGPFTSLTLKVN